MYSSVRDYKTIFNKIFKVIHIVASDIGPRCASFHLTIFMFCAEINKRNFSVISKVFMRLVHQDDDNNCNYLRFQDESNKADWTTLVLSESYSRVKIKAVISLQDIISCTLIKKWNVTDFVITTKFIWNEKLFILSPEAVPRCQ